MRAYIACSTGYQNMFAAQSFPPLHTRLYLSAEYSSLAFKSQGHYLKDLLPWLNDIVILDKHSQLSGARNLHSLYNLV